MLAKMTSKNQLTLPKSVTNALGEVEYFDSSEAKVSPPTSMMYLARSPMSIFNAR